MDFTIEFGGDPQDVTIALSGVATPEDFRHFNEARLSDERFRKGLVILLDASYLDTSQMSESMFQKAVEPMLERELNDPPLTFGRSEFASRRVCVAERSTLLAQLATARR